MQRLTSSLAQALAALLVVLLANLVIIVAAETVAWTLFATSWATTPEIEGVLMIWFGLLGAAWGTHQRIHLGVETLTQWMAARARALLGRLAAVLVAVFGSFLAFYGAKFAASVTGTLPATGLNASVHYVPIAVSGVLIMIFALEEALFGVPSRESDAN